MKKSSNFRPEFVHRLKVMTKFALILSNWKEYEKTSVPVEEITQAFISLAKIYSGGLLKDSCIWNEWNRFIFSFAKEIAPIFRFVSQNIQYSSLLHKTSFYSSDNLIAELTQHFWKPTNYNAASYIFFTQIANLLKMQNKYERLSV